MALPLLALAPLIGGALGGVGSIIGGAMNSAAQGDANKANIEAAKISGEFNQNTAREQMAFQEKMSSSAYQRATTDMKAAGINPMLAYAQGGASAPSGASGSMQAARSESTQPGEALKSGVQSAMALAALDKELESKDAGIALDNAAKAAKESEVELNKNAAWKATQDGNVSAAQERKMLVELPAQKAVADYTKKQAEIDKKLAIPDNIGRRAKEVLGIVNSASSLRKGGIKAPRNASEYINKYGETLNTHTGEYK